MFSVYVARRLQEHSRNFLPFVLRSLSPQHGLSNPPSSSGSPHSFIQSFHRTPTVHFGRHAYRHLSTLQPSHIQKLYEGINFTQLNAGDNEGNQAGLNKIIELLRSNFRSEGGESRDDFLDGSGVKPSEGLIISAIWALRDEWRLAFLVFKWGDKWSCNGEKVWSLMIWVLGNHKKFNNAWCLIRDLYRSSMDTQQAMLIMIDRYAAANEPAEAIRAFQIMDMFKLSPDQKALYTLLDALCKHGNVEEAEEFMLSNTKLFPLETEGFNIILNGWCNISVDIIEAKRVWREMDKCQILPDETSYTHMICCFSKVKNLFDALRLYDEMMRKGHNPNREVYNSLIYVLASENCSNEAVRILEKMKERGLRPESATYNFMICPLCEAGKQEDARSILSMMLGDNVNPSLDTYHAFLKGVNFEETLEILNRIGKSGLAPSRDTFLIILGELFKLGEVENALKIWVKMKECEVTPDSAHFTLMVEGLARHGLTVKARKLYAEMTSIGITEDPKLKKLLKESSPDGKHGKMVNTGKRTSKNGSRGTWKRYGKNRFIKGKQEKRGPQPRLSSLFP